ncbi:MAG: hypothetical protein ACRDJS_10630 [Actinomycetota bacterium]
MFVQVIEGRVTDADGLKRQLERWMDELKPDARGYLGSTGGLAGDRYIMCARFESEEKARSNSDSDRQSAWWAETEKCLEGVSFTDYTKAEDYLAGGSDDAGFVQIMRGRVTDAERARAMMKEMEDQLPQVRPDVIGGYTAYSDDGDYTEVVYFTSEAEARENEAKSSPDEMREWMEIQADEIRFIDLTEPMLDSK